MIIQTLLNLTHTRKRFLRDLIAVILITSGAIATVTLIQDANMRDNIAQEYIQENLTKTSDRIYQFYEPVESNALLVQKWGLAGI